MSLTLDLTPNRENRRGMIPTPEGALPKPRRSRRGHLDMAKWDAMVAADNAANGTASISEHHCPEAADTAPVEPTDPDGPPNAATALLGAETGATKMSREAILEPDDSPAAPPEAPAPQPGPQPAMTAEPEAFIPPPPPPKAAKPKPTKDKP